MLVKANTAGTSALSTTSSSNRIRVLRPVLIVLIAALHVPYALYRPDLLEVDLALGSYLSALISGCIAIAALPTLSVISGYLAGTKFGQRGYLAYAARKFRRLIIPMLVWGLPMAVWIYTRQAAGVGVRPDLDLYPFNSLGWFQALAGYQKLPANPPLYFLRELFLAALLLPMWQLVARSLIASALLAASIFYCNVAGINFGFFFRIDVYLYFFIGVFIAAHPGLHKIDDWICKHVSFVALAFLVVCISLAFYGFSEKPDYYWFLLNVLRLIGPLAFLAMSAWLVQGHAGKVLACLSPASYTMFLGHLIVIELVRWGWREWIGMSRYDLAWWGFFCLALVTAVVTLSALWWLYARLRAGIQSRLNLHGK